MKTTSAINLAAPLALSLYVLPACSDREPLTMPEPRPAKDSALIVTVEPKPEPIIPPLDPPIEQQNDIFLVLRGDKLHLVTTSGKVSERGYDHIEYDPQLGAVTARDNARYGRSSVHIIDQDTGEPLSVGSPVGIEKRGEVFYGLYERDCCPIFTDPYPLEFKGSTVRGVMTQQ